MRGNLLRIFYKSSVVKNQLPANYQALDAALFSNDMHIELPQSGLFLLRNVFITHQGIIYKNLSAIKENIVCYQADFKKYRFRYLLKSFLRSKRFLYRGKQCVIIFDNYSGPNGFAHWICDGLTRLTEINDALNTYTVVVPFYFRDQKIYTESLKLFNISDIHYLPENSITFFKEIHFPTPIGDTGNFHPENVKKLRAIISTKITMPENRNRNIYISRGKAKRRFVKNEKEVIELMERHQFETVYMEDHSFEDQIKMIAAAANIVSIHGAALAMLIFAGPGTSVLELRNKNDTVNNMYFLLANVCGLNYYYLGCESTEKAKSANDFDLKINLEELDKTTKQMISKQVQV